MMQGDTATAIRYRERAEEVRTIADAMKDATSRQILVGIAEAYERMARQMDDSADIDRRLRPPSRA